MCHLCYAWPISASFPNRTSGKYQSQAGSTMLCHSGVLGRISQLWLQSPAHSGLAFGIGTQFLKILGLLTFVGLSSWTWSTRTKCTNPYFSSPAKHHFFLRLSFVIGQATFVWNHHLPRAILAPTKFDICHNLAAEACWQISGVRETRLLNDAVQRAENHFECKIVQCSSLVAEELGQPCIIQVVLVSVSTETWGTAMC